MRLICLIYLCCPVFAFAQDSSRYGVALDTATYPQATAKQTLASVLKAIDAGKIDYLVAHLADPSFVDDRVKRLYGGKFTEQVQDTTIRLDPPTVKLLKRFAKEGTWTIGKTSAIVSLDDVRDRVVRLVLKDGRWFFSHDSSPER